MKEYKLKVQEDESDEMIFSSKELQALVRLKAGETIVVRLSGRAVNVCPCPLAGKIIEMVWGHKRGFVLGLREGVKGNRRHAYIIRLYGETYNASRRGFSVV